MQQLFILSFNVPISALKYTAQQRYLKAALCHKDVLKSFKIRFQKILKINVKTYKISNALTEDVFQDKVEVPPKKIPLFFFQVRKQIFDTHSPLTFFQPE